MTGRRIGAALIIGGILVVLGAGGWWLARDREDGASSGSSPEPTPGCPIEDVEEPGVSPQADVVGMATNFVWDLEADVDAELRVLAACGVRAIREDLLWELIEPRPAALEWERTDRVMLAAARAGVGVLGILGYSAPWASTDPSGAGERSFPPRDDAEFARYAAWVASRYSPTSSFWDDLATDFRPLLGLEIWNEAWGRWAWQPDPDPVRYAALARAAATTIGAVEPDVPIVLTADPFRNARSSGDRRWFEAVLDADPTLPDLIDVYAVHPYPEPRDVGPLVPRADPRHEFRRVEVTAEAARRRGVERPIWITEIGWSTADVAGAVDEVVQARHILDALARVEDDWPYVERVFLYTWARDRATPGDIESGFGLRRLDGSAKPALTALVRLLAEPPRADE